MKKMGLMLGLLMLPVMTACHLLIGAKNPAPSEEPPESISVVESEPVEPESVPVDSEPSETPVYPEGSPLGYLGEPVLCDVTGDGNDDECYCNMTGSGMVRVQCIVYDKANDVKYVLDGYDYSYDILGVEDGKLIVKEVGPYGYGHPLTETQGTVVIKNNRLRFVANPDSLTKGLIVYEKVWSETGGKDKEVSTVTILRHGEEVYSGFSSEIKIESASDSEIVLKIEGCLVEPNADGTIDMRKEPLTEITIQRDQTITLKSQTMDAGVTLEITYK